MYCPNCGTENAADAAFCASCGNALQNAQSETAVEEAVVEETVTEEVAVVELATEETAPITVEVTPAEEVETVTFTAEDDNGKNPGDTFGLVSMICGIAACGLVLISCVLLVALLLAFAAAVTSIIFGVLAKKKSKNAGMLNSKATLGIVFSIIALALIALSLIAYVVFILAFIVLSFLPVFLSLFAPFLMILGM